MRLEDYARHKDCGKQVSQQTKRQRHGETLNRAGAEQEQDGRRNDCCNVRIDDGYPCVRKSLVHCRRCRLAGTNLFANTLEDQHVRIHAHTNGEDDSGNTRQRQRGFGEAQEAEQNNQVEEQRQIRVDAGTTVVDEHERHYEKHAHNRGRDTLAYRIRAQGCSHGAVFKIVERSRQCAGAQHFGQNLDLYWRETARDVTLIVNAAIYTGYFAHVSAHQHGHALAHVLARIVVELFAGVVGQREVYTALAGVRIDSRISGAEVAAGNDGDPLQNINLIGIRAGSQSAGAVDDHLVGRKSAAYAGECRGLILERAADNRMNLKARGGLNDRLDAIEVADARQLHQNLIGAQVVFLNHRLAHTQRIHAIANCLDGLLDGFLVQILDDLRLHGQQQTGVVIAAGDIVLIRVFLIEQRTHRA